MSNNYTVTRSLSLGDLKRLTSELPYPRERRLPQGIVVKVGTMAKLSMISPAKAIS
jgi:hypothetical protein